MRRNESYLPSRQDWGGLSPRSPFGTSGSFPLFGSPWQMMRRMQEDMDRVFGQFFSEEGGQGGQQASGQPGIQQWAPRVDISQTDKEWCIEADLPGVKEADIDAQIQDHMLFLRAELRPEESPEGRQAEPESGQQAGEKPHNGHNKAEQAQMQQRQYHQRERRWGYFERVLSLPDNVDEEKVSCDFKNGVLTLHLPKMPEPASQGRRIPIGAGQARSTAGKQQPAMAGSRGGEVSSEGEKK